MLSFSVPHEKDFFSFSVEIARVMFAGSRNMTVPRQTCKDLISAFGRLGFCFLTGCAKGVDESFRHALAEQSEYAESTIVACAFRERAERLKDVFTLMVVPEGLAPKVALAKRTLWMTSRCSVLILFPSDPIGRGSALSFQISNSQQQTGIHRLKDKASREQSVYCHCVKPVRSRRRFLVRSACLC